MSSYLTTILLLACGQIFYLFQSTAEGKVILGAILPIHKDGQAGQSCGNASYHGIAIATAIKIAAAEINLEASRSGSTEPVIDYVIEDSCSNLQRAKGIAYKFNIEKRRAISGQNSTAVSAVLAEFSQSHLPVIQLLALEKTIQISYSANNARLQGRTKLELEELDQLFSAYPEDVTKMKALGDVIKTYNWQSVHVVIEDSLRGRAGLKVLQDTMETFQKQHRPCLQIHYVSETMESINKTVHTLAKNQLKSVVVLFCNQKIDQLIFHGAKKINMFNNTWISTTNWNNDLDTLRGFSRMVDGMLVIANKEIKPDAYVKYVYSLNPPIDDVYLKEAFQGIKGSEDCGVGGDQAQGNCKSALETLKSHLTKYADEVSYTMDAVYAVYKALEMKSKNVTAKEQMLKINIKNPLTGNHLAFDKNQAFESTDYSIYNIQGNVRQKLNFIKSGTWQSSGEPHLRLNKKDIRWKGDQIIVPLSMCSLDCKPGTYRQFENEIDQCCWKCLPCNAKSMSNVSNAISCLECPSGFVSTLEKTQCSKYEVDYFRWYRPSGEFLLVLITAGLCVMLFSLGIFSQNIESDVVIAGNYKSLTLILGGVALSFLCVVPLLLEPRDLICKVFVALFSISLTIPLSVFVTKSVKFKEIFYDEDGDVKRRTLGPRPKIVVVALICVLQLALVVGLMQYVPPRVLVTDTEEWNVKYVQCDCQSNFPLWAGLIYNILLTVAITLLSCSGTEMQADFGELNHICITTCMLFLDFFIFIAVTFGVEYKQMTLALGILSCLIGGSILACYFVPKLRKILCRKQKILIPTDSQPLIDAASDHPEKHSKKESFVPGSSPGMKRRLLQAKVKETHTVS